MRTDGERMDGPEVTRRVLRRIALRSLLLHCGVSTRLGYCCGGEGHEVSDENQGSGPVPERGAERHTHSQPRRRDPHAVERRTVSPDGKHARQRQRGERPGTWSPLDGGVQRAPRCATSPHTDSMLFSVVLSAACRVCLEVAGSPEPPGVVVRARSGVCSCTHGADDAWPPIRPQLLPCVRHPSPAVAALLRLVVSWCLL